MLSDHIAVVKNREQLAACCTSGSWGRGRSRRRRSVRLFRWRVDLTDGRFGRFCAALRSYAHAATRAYIYHACLGRVVPSSSSSDAPPEGIHEVARLREKPNCQVRDISLMIGTREAGILVRHVEMEDEQRIQNTIAGV